jgi:hypothetical protein
VEVDGGGREHLPAAAATRHHFENSVLREVELTWTGFVVLWVVWIFGETETRMVAKEAGISNGPLTGASRARRPLRLTALDG